MDRFEFALYDLKDNEGMTKIKIHKRLAREQTYEEHQIRMEPKITLIFRASGERNTDVVVRYCHVWPTLLHVYKPWIK